MSVTPQMKKAEAIRWMTILGIHPDIVHRFRNKNEVMICSGNTGAFTPLNDEYLIRRIRRFEDNEHCLVYLVIRTETTFGLLDSLLFVDDHSEEWNFAREELKSGYVLTYTINRDCPHCSEMGSILVSLTANGGLIRRG